MNLNSAVKRCRDPLVLLHEHVLPSFTAPRVDPANREYSRSRCWETVSREVRMWRNERTQHQGTRNDEAWLRASHLRPGTIIQSSVLDLNCEPISEQLKEWESRCWWLLKSVLTAWIWCLVARGCQPCLVFWISCSPRDDLVKNMMSGQDNITDPEFFSDWSRRERDKLLKVSRSSCFRVWVFMNTGPPT